MRMRSRNKCLFFIVALVMLTLPTLIVRAEEGLSTDSTVITLSPEQFAEHNEELRGYMIHTVVWLDDYTFGSAFATAREEASKPSFHFTGSISEKPDKNQYVEAVGICDGKHMGYVYFEDAIVLSKGEEAERILDQIDEEEQAKEPDITALIAAVDSAIMQEEEANAEEQKEKFNSLVDAARMEYEASSDILTLTPEQLESDHADLEGMKFHSVFVVNSVDEDKITAKLDQDDWLDSFYFYFDESDIDLREHIQKKDVVELTGIVKPGFWNTTDYTSCKILSVGDEAQSVLDSIYAGEYDGQVSTDNDAEKDSVSAISETGETVLTEFAISEVPVAEAQTAESTIDETPETDDGKDTVPEEFSSLLELISKENHPQLYDPEEDAKVYYKNALGDEVAITTWEQSITDYFDKAPEYEVLWLDGNPLDLGKGSDTIGFVTIDYYAIEQNIDIETAISHMESFIPSDVYSPNGAKEKYIYTEGEPEENYRICWVVHYDTLVSDLDRKDLAVVLYGDSEDQVMISYTYFSDSPSPGENYTQVDWATSADDFLKTVGSNEMSVTQTETTPLTEAFSPIGEGDKGDSVKEAQSMLIALGFLASTADGSFGAKTRQAVVDFQEAAGLEATGVIDENTYALLSSGEAPEKKETEPSFQDIKRGDSGDIVVEIQKRLIELYYLSGTADGKFGPGTERAVIEFQDAAGLSGTGVVDKQTFDELMSSYAPAKEATPETTPSTTAEASEPQYDYVCNKNTGVFHWPDCRGVRQMKESNKIYMHCSRSECINAGYKSCGICNP